MSAKEPVGWHEMPSFNEVKRGEARRWAIGLLIGYSPHDLHKVLSDAEVIVNYVVDGEFPDPPQRVAMTNLREAEPKERQS